MGTKKEKQRVPEKRAVRDLLRRETAVFVRQHDIYAPVRLEILEKLSLRLLKGLSLDTQFLHFTMVLMGNEIWKDMVFATPFARRLLLLPQCLRNHTECKGEFDELGLLCAGCKACNLDHILEKAEKLGYATLIAEGTTVAIGLVEEGSVDAVIGVSCLPVLQNSFGPVTRAAVPAIGLPLLYDGCKDTSLDYEWLFEEIGQYTENHSLKPISVSQLKTQVQDYFVPGPLKEFFPGNSETEKLALKVMAMGGQRMRPLLSVLSYLSYTAAPDEHVQRLLAVTIECFHKASLLHDDIQDNEDYRYEQPSLHRTEGVAMAINTGDYLIGKGYLLLSQVPCDAVVRAECLKVIAVSHLKLTEGQGADIQMPASMAELSVEGLIEIFAKKTGEAVKVALLMGAIAGHAAETEMEHLSRFSENFGIAYQIRDDLNEYREVNDKKQAFDFPFLLGLLRDDLVNEGANFSTLLEPQNFGSLQEQFVRHHTEQKAENYLQEYLNRCYHGLDLLQNVKLRIGLSALLGKIFTC